MTYYKSEAFETPKPFFPMGVVIFITRLIVTQNFLEMEVMYNSRRDCVY